MRNHILQILMPHIHSHPTSRGTCQDYFVCSWQVVLKISIFEMRTSIDWTSEVQSCVFVLDPIFIVSLMKSPVTVYHHNLCPIGKCVLFGVCWKHTQSLSRIIFRPLCWWAKISLASLVATLQSGLKICSKTDSSTYHMKDNIFGITPFVEIDHRRTSVKTLCLWISIVNNLDVVIACGSQD